MQRQGQWHLRVKAAREARLRVRELMPPRDHFRYVYGVVQAALIPGARLHDHGPQTHALAVEPRDLCRGHADIGTLGGRHWFVSDLRRDDLNVRVCGLDVEHLRRGRRRMKRRVRIVRGKGAGSVHSCAKGGVKVGSGPCYTK